MKHRRTAQISAAALAGNLILGGFSAQAVEETLQSMLAAQVRAQGFVCDRANGASRDARRSRPDHGVWVLRCSNATFRVSRAPDMAARIEPIR